MPYDQNYVANQSGLGSNYGSISNAVPQPEHFLTPLGRAEEALNELLAIAGRLTDRMVGSMPADNGKTALNPVSNGMFDDIAQAGRRMDEKIAIVREMLTRIEVKLP